MNTDQNALLYLAALSNIGLGSFLVFDSLFLHDLIFNYAAFGLTPSPYFHHAFWGLFFIFIGLGLFFVIHRTGEEE